MKTKLLILLFINLFTVSCSDIENIFNPPVFSKDTTTITPEVPYVEDFFTLSDPRFNQSGTTMYKNSYMDQPYIVKISSTKWFCVVTSLDGVKFTTGDGGIGLNVIALITENQGKTWTRVSDIEPSDPNFFLAWGVPYRTSYGRIYVFYQRIPLYNRSTTPVKYCYRYSDDDGKTWSATNVLPYRKTAIDLENDYQGVSYGGWSVSNPIRVNNEFYHMFTKTGKTYYYAKSKGQVGEGFIYHCSNIETEQDPSKLTWTMLPDGDRGISHPVDQNGFTGIQEEHQLVSLGGSNMYSVFRVKDLFLPGSYSSDLGRTWTTPQFETYYNGRKIRHNRACAKLYKTDAGKYLLWFNNHSLEHILGRDPIWISGGTLENGKIVWSQPEVLLYTDPRTYSDGLLGSGISGLSYPDFVEDNGNFWVTETDKAVSRIHKLNNEMLEGLWNQRSNKNLTTKGMVLEKKSIASTGEQVMLPALPGLKFGGIALEFYLTINKLSANQVLYDSRDANGRGVLISTVLNTTITEASSKKTYTITNTIGITINDGANTITWYADNNTLVVGKKTHLVFNVDGAANVLSVLVDGNLCDRSAVASDNAGWIRIPETMNEISTSTATLGSQYILIDQFRLYDRYLLTSEAIANYNSIK